MPQDRTFLDNATTTRLSSYARSLPAPELARIVNVPTRDLYLALAREPLPVDSAERVRTRLGVK